MEKDEKNADGTAGTGAPQGETKSGEASTDLQAENEKLKKQLSQAEFKLDEQRKQKKDDKPVDVESLKTEIVSELKKGLEEASKGVVETYEKKIVELKASLASATGKNTEGTTASVKKAPEATVDLSPAEMELVRRIAVRRKISVEDAKKIFNK